MSKIKVLYEKMPPKSRTRKHPSGVVFSYRWHHIFQMVKQVRDEANKDSMSLPFFDDYECYQVIVGDDEVTFYIDEKKT